jgi:RNA polymerase sigma factor (sigma-70 family)
MTLEAAGHPGGIPAGECHSAKDRNAVAETLVQQYRRPLLCFFRKRLHDWALAEDLAQETLQVVVTKIRGEGLLEPEKLSGFVFGTARFIASTHARNAKRRGDVRAAVALDDSLPDAGALPEQLAYQEQLRAMVRTLMQELTQPRDRELLWDFYVNGVSKEVLLERHAMKASQFDNALYRARQRLRELLLQWGWPQ